MVRDSASTLNSVGGSMKLQQIGIFCGTFNPIHNGHLLIAECARDQFGLKQVVFVTSPAPPHRQDELLDGFARHKLVEAAVADNDNFEANDLELHRAGKSYTVDTLEHMQTKYGADTKLNLIIGGDNLSTLHTWNRIHRILELARILVVPRLRYKSERTDGHYLVGTEDGAKSPALDGGDIVEVDFPGIAISGSKIRERIFQKKTVLYMVPRAVNDLILKHKYFAQQTPSGAIL